MAESGDPDQSRKMMLEERRALDERRLARALEERRLERASQRERERERVTKEWEVYTQALMRGSVEVSYGRVMLLGLAVAGKTSLMHGLMNEPLPDKAESTVLASTQSIRNYWVKTEQSHESCWAQVTIEDEIREEGLVVQKARMMSASQHRALPEMSSATDTTSAVVLKHMKEVPETMKSTSISQSSDSGASQHRALLDMLSATGTSAVVQEHMKEVLETMISTPTPQSSDSDTNKEVLLHIWDCGGQPVFLNVLPAFLSSRTVFLLVFDASVNLDEPCRVIVNYDGEQQTIETLDISGLHLLQRWMASIHARFGRVGKSANLPRYPRILLVGTHADCLTAGQSKQDVLEKIYSCIYRKDYSNMVIDGMVVDNTTAGMGVEEDKEIKKLRDNIHLFVQDKLCVATPVSWVQFRKVLQLHVKKDHPVISLDEVRRYAKESFVPKREVSSALSFYHELGVLLFYPKVPGLESVVILEPQWLVDRFGALLCKWKSRADHRCMWNILAVFGILIENLYNEVLEPILQGSQVSPQSIVEMLQHFLLAAPITTAGLHAASGEQKEYFVPLMLEHRLTISAFQEPSTDSPISSAVKRAATLYVTFESGYVAPGFYVRLATCLSDREGVVVLFEAGIYRNQITMRIGDADMLIITEHIDSVEVSFFRTLIATKSFRKSCREVHLMFRDCFSLISKWLPGVAPHVAFSCPQCESTQVSLSQARSCTFSVQHRASNVLHCKGVHSFYPSHSQRYWLKPDHVSRIEQAMEEKRYQSSEFTHYLTSAIGDKMADVAKELEMSLSDDLLEQFYDNGGDDIELAQCLRAVRMRALANKLVSGQLVAEEFHMSKSSIRVPYKSSIEMLNYSSASLAASIAAEAETQRSGEDDELRSTSEPISVKLLVDAVRNVSDWHNLGLHLGLTMSQLKQLQSIHRDHGEERIMAEMFNVWLSSCPDASWHKLVTALNAINKKRVAKEVESRYCCKQLSGSHAITVSSDAMATCHEDTDIHEQQPPVADGEEKRTNEGSMEDHNLQKQTGEQRLRTTKPETLQHSKMELVDLLAKEKEVESELVGFNELRMKELREAQKQKLSLQQKLLEEQKINYGKVGKQMSQAKDTEISNLKAGIACREKEVRSCAIQASYMDIAPDFLRGVETCGEHTMEVVGDRLPQKFTWPGYGFNIEVPDGALSHGVTASIAVKAILTGQFRFPENYQQISALYWISCSEVFLKHVAVNIQHCAYIATEEECTANFSFIVAKCSQENLPYTFIMRDGVFNPHTQYATVKLKRFSIVGAAATEDTKIYYVALKFYKQIPNTHDMNFQFAVLPAIDTFIKAFHADRKLDGWIKDDDDHQIIEFKDSSITLDISEPVNDWRILPRSHPVIYKSEVDQPTDRFPPCCTLEIQWVGGRPMTKLFYKVHLEGAQTPRDYFTISLHPKYLATVRETSKENCPTELELYEELAGVTANWRLLGMYLSLPRKTLDIVERDNPDVGSMMAGMLSHWLKKTPNASWQDVVEALRKMDENRMALGIEKKYCKKVCTPDEQEERTIEGSNEDHNLRRRTVAAENLHPCDVPHLPGHEEGRQSISEPDPGTRKITQPQLVLIPAKPKPASQCATLRCCTVFMIILFAMCTCIIANYWL